MSAYETQPVSHVEWVLPETLTANGYNPNHVATPELKLLAVSLLESGWTQPIVARPDGEIIDGYHRWTLAQEDQRIADLTGGLVPVVRIHAAPADQRMATIRHNRARGQHAVMAMAAIVNELVDMGVPIEEIRVQLGMDAEEVSRLADRGDKMKRSAGTEFGSAWRPAPTGERITSS